MQMQGTQMKTAARSLNSLSTVLTIRPCSPPKARDPMSSNSQTLPTFAHLDITLLPELGTEPRPALVI